MTLYNGTITTNNFTVNIDRFYAANSAQIILNIGSSIFNINNGWISNFPSFILNSGTSTINFANYSSLSSSNLVFYDVNFMNTGIISADNNTFRNVNFYGEGTITNQNTFNDVNFFSSAYMDGNSVTHNGNTFHNVKIDGNGLLYENNNFNNLTFAAGYTYTLENATIQTVNNKLQIQGSCNNYIILESSTQGSFATITKPTGAVLGFNIHIKDIYTTGGAIFNAYNSVNLGGNTGWLFSTLVPLLPPNVIVGPSTVCAGATGVVYHTAPVAGSIGYQWMYLLVLLSLVCKAIQLLQ